MGLPAEEISGQAKGKDKRVPKETDGQNDDEDEEIRKLMAQMESELKGHGALDLDPKPKTKTATSIKESGEEVSRAKQAEAGEDEGEASDEAVDIDYNLAKNLLESFKSQGGMAGPTGNLLGLMGMSLPRDEEDLDDEKK